MHPVDAADTTWEPSFLILAEYCLQFFVVWRSKILLAVECDNVLDEEFQCLQGSRFPNSYVLVQDICADTVCQLSQCCRHFLMCRQAYLATAVLQNMGNSSANKIKKGLIYIYTINLQLFEPRTDHVAEDRRIID
jgi:hypothetical protein